jgi:hypothetical protein
MNLDPAQGCKAFAQILDLCLGRPTLSGQGHPSLRAEDSADRYIAARERRPVRLVAFKVRTGVCAAAAAGTQKIRPRWTGKV